MGCIRTNRRVGMGSSLTREALDVAQPAIVPAADEGEPRGAYWSTSEVVPSAGGGPSALDGQVLCPVPAASAGEGLPVPAAVVAVSRAVDAVA